MKKAVIITVAGTSTRFRKSIGKDCLKCIYTENSKKDTLLYRLVNLCRDFDRIVIVGGYKFEELEEFVKTSLSESTSKITLVNNGHYEDLGSGFSLYLGVMALKDSGMDEILFAEGDLFFDTASFSKIIESPYSVITTNNDPIEAKKAVAFYLNTKGKVKYIYDTNHSALEIKEPFLGIYNSGQVWKFSEPEKIFSAAENLTDDEMKGTNLVLIQKYFDSMESNHLQVVHFNKWINCNTVEDYRKYGEIK